jgi:asparagine synthase (glutamine-hydrolysing)
MSAIFGILRFDGSAVSARDLERMGNTLAHRGPDGRKFVVAGPAGLGHCLMRVNQEDLFERQPIVDRAADLTLVADLRLDNREELAGIFGIGAAKLCDMPDSALVLLAYRKWGEACAEHLVGDFAFAIWDGGAGKLVLGRDHMGQRNVYYHEGGNFFAFATEIKALWALADVPRRLRDEEIARFFHMRVIERPEGLTLYSGIHTVSGGTVLTVEPARAIKIKSRRYWEPDADPVHENRDEDYYVETYRKVLTEAVACRLRRLTAPAALMMSAGFDTAAIAGLAVPVVTAQGRKLICLSWLGPNPDDPARGDMRPWLEACRRFMPHLDVRALTADGENPLRDIERAFVAHDGPGGSRRSVRNLFAEAAAAGARLIMNGLGGDYTVNPRGSGALAGYLRRGQFRRFAAELRPHLRETGQSLWQCLKGEIAVPLLPPYFVHWQRYVRQVGPYAKLKSALRDIEGPTMKKLRRRNAAQAEAGSDWIPRAAIRAANRHLADRLRCGAATGWTVETAARGLCLTQPFHDKRVVELGLAIPEDLYIKNGVNRYLARRALADIYPPEFQRRGRDNVGTLDEIAVPDWAISELLSEADRLGKSAKLSAYFDFERARDFLSSPNTLKKKAALRAFLTARFIEWFDRANEP